MLNPINDTFEYLRKGQRINSICMSDIDKKGHAILTTTLPPRHKLLTYYRLLVDSFNLNMGFVVDIIEWNKTDSDLLRTTLRTLLELYTRMLFLVNSDENTQLKRIIGDEFWTFRNDLNNHTEMLKQSRDLADKQILDLPDINAILASNKIIRNKYKRDWTFHGLQVKNCINDYHDELLFPDLTKEKLSTMYEWFSNQLHGNVFWNMANIPVEPKYQILFVVIILHTRFLHELLKVVQVDNKAVEEYIEEAKEGTKGLTDLWKVSRRINNLDK